MRIFYELCVLLCPHGALWDNLTTVTRQDVIDRVEAGGSQTVKLNIGRLLFQFSGRGDWARALPAWNDWRAISNRDVGYRVNKRERPRESLTEDELNRLLKVAREGSVLDRLTSTAKWLNSAWFLVVPS